MKQAVHYYVQNVLPLDVILSHFNPVNTSLFPNVVIFLHRLQVRLLRSLSSPTNTTQGFLNFLMHVTCPARSILLDTRF
jgi:hypothetical protein